jgi:hypothetical protein
MKISDFFFSFFSTLNQYFPHIPYVASKNGRKIVEKLKIAMDNQLAILQKNIPRDFFLELNA